MFKEYRVPCARPRFVRMIRKARAVLPDPDESSQFRLRHIGAQQDGPVHSRLSCKPYVVRVVHEELQER